MFWFCWRPVEEGGFVGFCDEEGNICLSQSTFEKIVPYNYSSLKSSHLASCMCSDCMDAQYQHEDLMAWRNCKLKWFQRKIKKLMLWFSENLQKSGRLFKKNQEILEKTKEEMKEFRNDVFR